MLKKQLEKYTEEGASKAPEEVIKTMQHAFQKLVNNKIDKNSLKKGDKAPEFSLQNSDGKMISSENMLKKGPLIISFIRGTWCPYCNLEIAAWKEIYPKVKEAGAELLVISPNIKDKHIEMKEKYKIEFNILSDTNNKIANKFGLVFTLPEELRPIYKNFGVDIPAHNGNDKYELPIPATYVIKDGIIIYSFVDIDYRNRAEPSEVLEVISN